MPEASGLAYWVDQMAAGQTYDQIAAQFYSASVIFGDATGYSANMPLETFIHAVYANALGREGEFAPSQTEVNWWLGEFAADHVTRETLVQRFLSDVRAFTDDPQWGF